MRPVRIDSKLLNVERRALSNEQPPLSAEEQTPQLIVAAESHTVDTPSEVPESADVVIVGKWKYSILFCLHK